MFVLCCKEIESFKLGRGECGIKYLYTDKVAGDTFACKSISKKKTKMRKWSPILPLSRESWRYINLLWWDTKEMLSFGFGSLTFVGIERMGEWKRELFWKKIVILHLGVVVVLSA